MNPPVKAAIATSALGAALDELNATLGQAEPPIRLVQNLNTTGAEPPPIMTQAQPYERKNEQLWHRMALELALRSGLTANEIAPIVGRTPEAVRQILAQQKTRQYAADVCKQVASVDQRVRDHIEQKVLRAVETLSGIMEDEGKQSKDRINAARELLNRRYGMPNQPIGKGTVIDLNNLPDAELARIASEGN